MNGQKIGGSRQLLGKFESYEVYTVHVPGQENGIADILANYGIDRPSVVANIDA